MCALGLPTSDSGGSGTTAPPSDVTTTTVVSSDTTTTTVAPGAIPAVAGAWRFEGTVATRGCGIDASYDAIQSTLSMSQDGTGLAGAIEGAPAGGAVDGAGWSFTTRPDCRQVPGASASCCLTFGVTAAAFGSPATADGRATAQCDDGSRCEARWSGTVTKGN